jgi:hypothetical protein
MPLQDIPVSYSRFQEQGLFINGGNWHYGSGNVGKTAEFQWPRQDSKGMEVFNSLLFNKYGNGYVYYHDPFAVNILPNYLSLPTRALDYVQTWDRFAEYEQGDAVPSNSFDLPLDSIDINIPNNGLKREFTFVVPDGYSIGVSIKGDPIKSTTTFRLEWGADTYELPVSDTTNLWDTVISPGDNSRVATLKVTAPGILSLYGLMLTITNEHANVNSLTRKYPNFRIGTGQSGCKLTNDASNALFALGTPWEQSPASLALTETEWFSQ